MGKLIARRQILVLAAGLLALGLAKAPARAQGFPELSTSVSNGSVVLTWPAGATGIVLETSEKLGLTGWVPVLPANPPVVLAPFGKPAFFRLKLTNAASLANVLELHIVGTNLALAQTQDFIERRVPILSPAANPQEWQAQAEMLRNRILDSVVFRGEAAQWRVGQGGVEWLGSIPGGPGYRIRKLRYEIVPKLWVPALLYEPEGFAGRVPVALSFVGHEPAGKAVEYEQLRCINLAKRGMIVLCPEWIGMGELNSTNLSHYRMNQLDLCGTSGLGVFYLEQQRGLDLLLAHPNADPERVAVSGLSGGGWQTIFLSALDLRVTLSNPAAGYSSFRTRVRHPGDLGDSEQTPSDLATVADYTHLTALRAPRPTLLTYNSRETCCFDSDYAVAPLFDAAFPVFQQLGVPDRLRVHINDDPGTHNFEIDNRQAYYRFLGEYFFPGAPFETSDIPSAAELKTQEALAVGVPATNASFNSLAIELSAGLPRNPALPTGREEAAAWLRDARADLTRLTKAAGYSAVARAVGTGDLNGTAITFWRIQLGTDWTVPVVEFSPAQPNGCTLLFSELGRAGLAAETGELLQAGQRVLAVDPFYFGESKLTGRDFLLALLVAAVGERPLGIQASQIGAVARWAASRNSGLPVSLLAVGPRASVIGLVAAGLEEDAIDSVELRGSLGSLKQILELNWSSIDAPELFCFGLLERFDLKQLAALSGGRRLRWTNPALPPGQWDDLARWFDMIGGELVSE